MSKLKMSKFLLRARNSAPRAFAPSPGIILSLSQLVMMEMNTNRRPGAPAGRGRSGARRGTNLPTSAARGRGFRGHSASHSILGIFSDVLLARFARLETGKRRTASLRRCQGVDVRHPRACRRRERPVKTSLYHQYTPVLAGGGCCWLVQRRMSLPAS